MQAVIFRRSVGGRAFLVVVAITGSVMLGGLGGYWVKATATPEPGRTIVVAPAGPADPGCPAGQAVEGLTC